MLGIRGKGFPWFLLHPHVHRDHHGFERPGQGQRALDRDGLMGGTIRFTLVVVAVCPKGEAVLDVVPGRDPADGCSPPFGGGQDSAVGVADRTELNAFMNWAEASSVCGSLSGLSARRETAAFCKSSAIMSRYSTSSKR